MENNTSNTIDTFAAFAKTSNYSLMDDLSADPQSTTDGNDHNPRQVFSGHYVLVKPTPITNPEYITHSKTFFKELGLDDSLANDKEFMKMFSGDTRDLPKPLKPYGWATGYALSIYGSEYYDQCPFRTGNGYGDGRAMSIFEGILNNQRWEMQLKGGGRTPYCRGADGRAVLRSSVREFLAQELMYGLGVPTSRSLTLYTSKSETVQRPWFNNGSYSRDPERMIEENVAISTRVAPSFLRVGQVELFGRRARKNEHPKALEELQIIIKHVIKREYKNSIDSTIPFEEQVIQLATQFRERLTALVVNWIRVGYCQGNFNSDNTALGGYTLDYGPFGFIDMFDPRYQPWTGGGVHFSFFNQIEAAKKNYKMFCLALEQTLKKSPAQTKELEELQNSFNSLMYKKLNTMWAEKLGLEKFDEEIFNELIVLMIDTSVDYTIFFRELSSIPDEISPLVKSFYGEACLEKNIMQRWIKWLDNWKDAINVSSNKERELLSEKMKKTNPKHTLREWILVPAYKAAEDGDYTLIKELQEIIQNPYDEHTPAIEEKYYAQKPIELFDIAGVSHISCSS